MHKSEGGKTKEGREVGAGELERRSRPLGGRKREGVVVAYVASALAEGFSGREIRRGGGEGGERKRKIRGRL